MPVDEDKAATAFDYVDEAERLVSQLEFAKAIFKLQQAMDLFDKCGLPPAKKRQVIDMVSSRQAEISQLKQYIKDHPEAVAEMTGQAAQSQMGSDLTFTSQSTNGMPHDQSSMIEPEIGRASCRERV